MNEFSQTDIKALDLTMELNTSGNTPLIELPEEIFQFQLLTRLHLDGNQLHKLPNALGN